MENEFKPYNGILIIGGTRNKTKKIMRRNKTFA